MDEAAITAPLVRRLLGEQFPQWADLAVTPVEVDGWDNVTFRLGDDMSVRLPSADGYVAQVDKEHRWLPVLAPLLPLSIPEPLAKGLPTDAFPRPWSVYGWRPGSAATEERVDDRVRFAADLAEFLHALQAIETAGGPPAGAHSAFRGGPLQTYDDETRATIAALGRHVDAARATAVWRAAVATRWERPAVWVHGDVVASNLLVVDGALSAVIDFGCLAVGDPACDLAIAWTFLSGASRDAFHRKLSLDEPTWVRARGWALWKALITLGDSIQHGTPGVAERRAGWRTDAPDLIDELIDDGTGT